MDTRFWNYALVFALAGSAVSAAQAQTQTPCTDENIGQAVQAYERGHLIETIRKLEPCLDDLDSLEEQKKVEILRLLTFAYFYRDDLNASSQTARLLVREVDRDYRAQTGDPRFFRELIDKHQLKLRQKPWFQAGAVAVVWGGLRLLFSRLNKPGSLTAKPPGPP